MKQKKKRTTSVRPDGADEMMEEFPSLTAYVRLHLPLLECFQRLVLAS